MQTDIYIYLALGTLAGLKRTVGQATECCTQARINTRPEYWSFAAFPAGVFLCCGALGLQLTYAQNWAPRTRSAVQLLS